MSGFLAGARNDTFGFVMLNGAQRSEASTLDNGFLSMLGMTARPHPVC